MSVNDVVETFKRYQDAKSYLHEILETLKDRLHEIDQDLDCEYDFECSISLPQTQENILDVFLMNGWVVSEWEYIDQYEDICNSHTSWRFPVEWLAMNKEELKDVVIAFAKERNKKAMEQQVNRLKNEAEHYGYELVTKTIKGEE